MKDKYIKRNDAVFAACQVLDKFGGCKMGPLCPDVGCAEVRDIVDQYICNDVVNRDEGIKMGAELAAMHGSDATSQDLENSFWQGVEEGFRKARKTGKWTLKIFDDGYGEYELYECDQCGDVMAKQQNFCPNCGAKMEET